MIEMNNSIEISVQITPFGQMSYISTAMDDSEIEFHVPVYVRPETTYEEHMVIKTQVLSHK